MSRLTKKRRFVPLLVADDGFAPDGDGDSGPGGAAGGGYLLGAANFLEKEDGTGNLLIEQGGETLINDLVAATELDVDELLFAVDDPGGSPLDRKITLQQFLDSFNNLTSGAATADQNAKTPLVLDPSGTPDPRSVTLEVLYQYLLTIGAILPDGFQLRTHVGSNAGMGSQAQFQGPGFWTESGSSEVVINDATATDDMFRVYQNSRFWFTEMWTVMRQLAKTNWVGRTWNNSGTLNNRWTYGWVSANIINSDVPASPAAMFHCKVGDRFWRVQIHDGTSVTYDALTSVSLDQSVNRYSLGIEFTNTPSIIFTNNGSPILTRTTGLPNINTDSMYMMVGIGNSDANAWIEIQKLDVIIPNY